ncbi:TetR/AcrR family transcriptional regulator [Gluconobacter cerinus]|uniref:TetR family transcriptional regulator n=1 Tax=Gluconobacter cerinus TaxID=38307 RepID=A0AAV5NCG7_9PROT|nr:TetR/AcrR family transcriptional regulator [Gluconobacter cerinus]GBQ96954.1 TetR family transcriptional regulator [Gluconobacter cerinus NRIC 0229]GLQ62003.1 TetR family transcriptional regulator [Gluconobacter cerinus]
MANLPKRTNRPEAVKSDLLNAAAQILTTRGIQAFTLELVAKEAGVSKGGLLHHFSNKKALLDGLFIREMEAFRQHILATMQNDPVKVGRAARAYIGIGQAPTSAPPVIIRHLLAAMLIDPQISQEWTHHYWQTIKSIGLFENITTPQLLACLAMDGLSLWDILETDLLSQKSREDLEKLMTELTGQSEKNS